MTTPQPERSEIFVQLITGLRLKLRLLGDRRVSIWLKLAFILGFLWVFFPDLVIGPFDDALVLYFLIRFEDFCPQYVVKEILEAIENENLGKNGSTTKPTGRYVFNQNGSPIFLGKDQIPEVDGPLWEEVQDPTGKKYFRRYR